ncbi:MAG: DUF4272 domain-containing protein [Bacteroidota bacterium]
MKTLIVCLFTALLLTACFGNRKKASFGLKIQDLKKQEETENSESFTRKYQSIEYCLKYDLPINVDLPEIETEAQSKIRSKEEIVSRTFALLYLGIKSEGTEAAKLKELEEKYDIRKCFTTEELAYVDAANPTQQQTVNANWRYESMHVLLWALGYIDSLSYPNQLCNVGDDVLLIWANSKTEFMAKAQVRSKKEILDQADLIYRIHWACVNARINDQEPPGQLNNSVVYERHYVLNWLINHMDQTWDNISTDT